MKSMVAGIVASHKRCWASCCLRSFSRWNAVGSKRDFEEVSTAENKTRLEWCDRDDLKPLNTYMQLVTATVVYFRCSCTSDQATSFSVARAMKVVRDCSQCCAWTSDDVARSHWTRRRRLVASEEVVCDHETESARDDRWEREAVELASCHVICWNDDWKWT